MIFGKTPYNADSMSELIEKSYQNQLNLDQGPEVSTQTKYLIKKLLDPYPSSRISHEELFEIVLDKRTKINNLFTLPQNSPEAYNDDDEESSSGSNNEDDKKLKNYLKKIIFERNKYAYLIHLAKSADNFKE